MSKVHVTVELTFNKLDDTASRELAKQLIEGRGLTVVRTSVPNTGEAKSFTPKAGKPGSVLRRDGRTFEVWCEGPNTRDLWVVPVDRREGDATVYLTGNVAGSAVHPYHGDGKECRSTFVTNADYTRTEVPCQHESHSRAAA